MCPGFKILETSITSTTKSKACIKNKTWIVRLTKSVQKKIVFYHSRIHARKTIFLYMTLKVTITSVILLALLAFPLSPQAQVVFRGYHSDNQNGAPQKGKKVIKGFYEDSTLHYSISLKKGNLDGMAREFYPNGLLKFEVEYDKGIRKGVASFYYGNGILMAKLRYRRNKVIGTPDFYDENGIQYKFEEHRIKATQKLADFITNETIIPEIEEWHKTVSE